MNFMNLATARSSKRRKRNCFEKSGRSEKKEYSSVNFLVKSLLFAFAAFLLSIFFNGLLPPGFRNFSGKNLSLDLFGNISFLLALIGIAAVTGVNLRLLSGFISFFFSVGRSIKRAYKPCRQEFVV